jgi:hypothetical protein
MEKILIFILGIVSLVASTDIWYDGMPQIPGTDTTGNVWYNGMPQIQHYGGGGTNPRLKWQGGISANAATAGNYYPARVPTITDTLYLDSGVVNWVMSSVLSVGHLKIHSGYTGTVKYNDTLHVNYLGIHADSSLFTMPVIVRDSVVYDSTSIPIGQPGGRIQSVAGYTLTIKPTNKTGYPRVVNKGKIRWQ